MIKSLEYKLIYFYIGWGLSEYVTNSNEPMLLQTTTTILNSSYCYSMEPVFATYSSARSFCAGSDNAFNNQRDSGGGTCLSL